MGEILINQKFNVHNKDNEMNIINPYRYASSVNIYETAFACFSLRNIFSDWTNAILKIRRSSDNATAYLFFDGTTITTSSNISTTSNTTPDATTLSTWVSTDDAYVEEWYSQYSDNVIDYKTTQTTTSNQPKIITAGAIITVGSLPAIDFLSGSGVNLGDATPLTELGDGNDFSMFSVSTNNTSENIGSIWANTLGGGSKLRLFNDRRTSSPRRILLVTTQIGGNFGGDLITTANTGNQKLLSGTINSSDEVAAWYNGGAESTSTWTNSYTNASGFYIGLGQSTPLNGTIQELIMLPSDLTSDVGTYHTEINSYYSIY